MQRGPLPGRQLSAQVGIYRVDNAFHWERYDEAGSKLLGHVLELDTPGAKPKPFVQPGRPVQLILLFCSAVLTSTSFVSRQTLPHLRRGCCTEGAVQSLHSETAGGYTPEMP